MHAREWPLCRTEGQHHLRTILLGIIHPGACYEKEYVERVMGIEPTLEAWEAAVLPLNYTRGLQPINFYVKFK